MRKRDKKERKREKKEKEKRERENVWHPCDLVIREESKQGPYEPNPRVFKYLNQFEKTNRNERNVFIL